MASYPFFKRLLDIVVGAVLIVVSSPLWILAALATRLSSPGPLLFVQERGGMGGIPFRSYKFRTMRSDHVHDIHEVVPLTHGAITPVGRLLRRSKIDELPQLLNVLKGDMSLVGPRPTIMEQVRAYDEFQRKHLDVRPGCTGLAQVNSNATVVWEERIRYDVYYVQHLGFWMDVMILAKTVLVILLGEVRFTRPFEQSPYGRQSPHAPR